MKISKSAITRICQYFENKGLPVLADELFASEVKTEFRYLLSLYGSDRSRFIFSGERVTVYRNDEPYPSVLWNLNRHWEKNLQDYQDLGDVTEQVISGNLQQFIR